MSAIDQAVSQAQNETKNNTLVAPSSYNEFKQKNGGKAYAHHQDLKTSEGEPFVKLGIRFGQCFAAFSKKVVDAHPNMDGVAIAKDVNSNPDLYQVRHVAHPDTKEPLYNANNQPIMIVDLYTPLGEDDCEL